MTNFITVIKRDVSTMFCTDKLLCVNVRDYVACIMTNDFLLKLRLE